MKINAFISLGKWIVALMLFILTTAGTSMAQTFTLGQVLDSIALSNPGLQQFALKTSASFYEGEATLAWAAPTAGFGLSEFPYHAGQNTNGYMMPRKMIMMRLQQMLPNFSRQKKERDYYRSLSDQNRDDSATMKSSLFARAKTAYYRAYVAEKKSAVVQKQQKQIALLIEIATGRLAYGKSDLPDIYKAKAKHADLQATQIRLQAICDQATVVLNSLMNRPQQMPLQIDTTIDVIQADPVVLQIDTGYVLAHRSDIMRISDQIQSMQINKEVLASTRKPTFGIDWDNMRMDGGGYMYNVMATVSVPIAPWFSKGNRLKTKAIDYRIEAMQKMQDNQVQEAIGEINKDWLKLQAVQKEVRIFKNEIIPAYAKTYQAYLNAYSENTRDIYETLAAWNELSMKEMEYWDKISDLLNIRVILEAEMQSDQKTK